MKDEDLTKQNGEKSPVEDSTKTHQGKMETCPMLGVYPPTMVGEGVGFSTKRVNRLEQENASMIDGVMFLLSD